MPFYRFENREVFNVTSHLSSGKGPIIEGETLYFCRVNKEPGTGSQVHYHPNEQFQFPLQGRLNGLVGKDRIILSPGMMSHIPLFAQHQMAATEDAPCDYLYVKTKNWTVVGMAVDEGVPDKAPTIQEVDAKYAAGKWAGQEKDPQASKARSEGLGKCIYRIWDGLDCPAHSGYFCYTVGGELMTAKIVELPPGTKQKETESAFENFGYVISGSMKINLDGEERLVEPGDVIHAPKHSKYSLEVPENGSVRCFWVEGNQNLEDMLAES
jgi:quercetin dioxygenase-like cupin family protein